LPLTQTVATKWAVPTSTGIMVRATTICPRRIVVRIADGIGPSGIDRVIGAVGLAVDGGELCSRKPPVYRRPAALIAAIVYRSGR
jgi:hypothetical protein